METTIQQVIHIHVSQGHEMHTLCKTKAQCKVLTGNDHFFIFRVGYSSTANLKSNLKVENFSFERGGGKVSLCKSEVLTENDYILFGVKGVGVSDKSEIHLESST